MRLIDADKLKKHYAWWDDDKQKLFDEIVDQQPTIEMPEPPKWILPEDRMPENGPVRVLVTRRTGWLDTNTGRLMRRVEIAGHEENFEWDDSGREMPEGCVVAWMPLPEP